MLAIQNSYLSVYSQEREAPQHMARHSDWKITHLSDETALCVHPPEQTDFLPPAPGALAYG